MTSISIAVDYSSGPVPLDQAITGSHVEMYNEASCLTNYPPYIFSKLLYKQKVAFLRNHLFLALYTLPAPRVGCFVLLNQ